jgi:hypothetical protein
VAVAAAAAGCTTERTRRHSEAAAEGTVRGAYRELGELEIDRQDVEDSLEGYSRAVVRGSAEALGESGLDDALVDVGDRVGAGLADSMSEGAARAVARSAEAFHASVETDLEPAVDALVASAVAAALETTASSLEESVGPATEAYLRGRVAPGMAVVTRAAVTEGVAAFGEGMGELTADLATSDELREIVRTVASESVLGFKQGVEEAFPGLAGRIERDYEEARSGIWTASRSPAGRRSRWARCRPTGRCGRCSSRRRGSPGCASGRPGGTPAGRALRPR